MLDLRTRLFLWMLRATGRSFRPEVSVRAMRAGYVDMNRRFGFSQSAQVVTEDRTVPTSDGATIAARVYRPLARRSEQLPVLLYFHGGGWVIGDVDAFDHLTRFFAVEGDVMVVSVDYRRGPEHRFPTAFDDGFSALKWLHQSAAELGVDARRIAVGGDSAGGGIAAALSTYAEDHGIARPMYQFLIYPPVDGSGRFPSRRAFPRGVPLTTAMMDWFSRHHLRSAADLAAPYMMLLDAPSPERLPPTYILAVGYDPLVDEGRAYAARLREAGVAVVYDLHPTLAHGFVSFPRLVPAGRRALRHAIRAVGAALRA